MTSPLVEQVAGDFADELRKWWSFDDGQFHTHSWHSREDFIADKLPSLLERAIQQAVGDGWRDIVEMCAKVAETNPYEEPNMRAVEEFVSRPIRRQIAAAIRALPLPPGAPKPPRRSAEEVAVQNAVDRQKSEMLLELYARFEANVVIGRNQFLEIARRWGISFSASGVEAAAIKADRRETT